MKKRKTIEVEYLKNMANRFCESSSNELDGERRHIASFVSNALMMTGNYKGFGYLSRDDVKPGMTYGIDRSTVPHSFPDESRIFFY